MRPQQIFEAMEAQVNVHRLRPGESSDPIHTHHHEDPLKVPRMMANIILSIYIYMYHFEVYLKYLIADTIALLEHGTNMLATTAAPIAYHRIVANNWGLVRLDLPLKREPISLPGAPDGEGNWVGGLYSSGFTVCWDLDPLPLPYTPWLCCGSQGLKLACC